MNYEEITKKIKRIASQNLPVEEKMEQIISCLYEEFEKYNWIGVYLVKNNKLVLGPWRGEKPTEHTVIPIGKGICGAAAKTGRTEIVPDVKKDDRYLACFTSTRSEIVVPIKKNGRIIGEIDIDSDFKNSFNEKDAFFLEKIATIISDFVN